MDTEELLEEAVRSCDSLLEDDGYLASLRDCSEREERISTLITEKDEVLETSCRGERCFLLDTFSADRRV